MEQPILKLSGKSTAELYTLLGFHLQNSLQISNCSHINAGLSLSSQLKGNNIKEEDVLNHYKRIT